MSPAEFIKNFLPEAWEIQLDFGLQAASMLAQAALETGWGQYVAKSETGVDSKNLFNIKGTGPAGSISVLTHEYLNGNLISVKANFKVYNNYSQSFLDYAQLITGTVKYAPAVAAAGDPKEYLRQLQLCGYATDPNYASNIIRIMDSYNIINEVEIYVSEVSDYAKTSWSKAVAKGIVDGTSPKGAVTREMLVTVLNNCGLLDAGEVPQEVVDALKTAGIINSDHPAKSPVTWGELAAVISRMKTIKYFTG